MREGPPPPTCHVSCVTCHVSHVTYFFYFFLQSCQASWWMVCYQLGLPRIARKHVNIIGYLEATCGESDKKQSLILPYLGDLGPGGGEPGPKKDSFFYA